MTIDDCNLLCQRSLSGDEMSGSEDFQSEKSHKKSGHYGLDDEVVAWVFKLICKLHVSPCF